MKIRKRSFYKNQQKWIGADDSLKDSKTILSKNNFFFHSWKKRLKKNKTQNQFKVKDFYVFVWKKRRKNFWKQKRKPQFYFYEFCDMTSTSMNVTKNFYF